jgi:hypothetical protein
MADKLKLVVSRYAQRLDDPTDANTPAQYRQLRRGDVFEARDEAEAARLRKIGAVVDPEGEDEQKSEERFEAEEAQAQEQAEAEAEARNADPVTPQGAPGSTVWSEDVTDERRQKELEDEAEKRRKATQSEAPKPRSAAKKTAAKKTAATPSGSGGSSGDEG